MQTKAFKVRVNRIQMSNLNSPMLSSFQPNERGKTGKQHGGPQWRGLSPCSSGERAEIPRVPPPVPAARPAQRAPTASPGYQATWLPGKGSATTAGTVGHGASVVGVGGEGLWGQKWPERTHLQATDPQGAGPWFGLPWGTEQRGHPGQHLWATPSFRPLSARPPPWWWWGVLSLGCRPPSFPYRTVRAEVNTEKASVSRSSWAAPPFHFWNKVLQR